MEFIGTGHCLKQAGLEYLLTDWSLGCKGAHFQGICSAEQLGASLKADKPRFPEPFGSKYPQGAGTRSQKPS